MNDKVVFPCSRCGECCRHIDRVPQLKMYDNGEGCCVFLNGNECTIYETRPEVCRVDTMYEKYYAHQYSREEFWALNEQVCHILQNNM